MSLSYHGPSGTPPSTSRWPHSGWHFSSLLPPSRSLSPSSSSLSFCRLCLFWELIQQPTADQEDRGVEQGECVHVGCKHGAASVLTAPVSFCSSGSFVFIFIKVGDDREEITVRRVWDDRLGQKLWFIVFSCLTCNLQDAVNFPFHLRYTNISEVLIFGPEPTHIGMFW